MAYSVHMEYCFAPKIRRQVVKAALSAAKYLPEFDAIAYSGQSGAIWASILAYHLDKPLILVRKAGDNSHSKYKVEGLSDVKRYIIIDDFISSGKTYNYITSMIKKDLNDQAECLGCLCVHRTYEKREREQKSEIKYWFQKAINYD